MSKPLLLLTAATVAFGAGAGALIIAVLELLNVLG